MTNVLCGMSVVRFIEWDSMYMLRVSCVGSGVWRVSVVHAFAGCRKKAALLDPSAPPK
jgi:hypothetical protein